MPQLNEHPQFVEHLIAERVRYQEEQRQQEMRSSVPAVVTFRLVMILVSFHLFYNMNVLTSVIFDHKML